MNRTHLIPNAAPEFRFVQRVEQLQRCEQMQLAITKCEEIETDIRSKILLPEDRAERLAYVQAVKAKLEHRHEEIHRCYPFSIN